MQYFSVLIIGAVVFGLCFLVDKGLTKLFRNRREHQSGLAVRHNKKTMAFGLIAVAVGVAAILSGGTGGMVFYIGGAVLGLIGVLLIVIYSTFGVFYDDDGFLLTTFGNKTMRYTYREIRTQQLFNSAGTIVIELHMADGNAVQLQSSMDGVYPFLDKAFEAWLRQTGRKKEDCPFYEPDNSRWFPETEE